MLKNKTIFKSIAVALIMVMMVAALSPGVGVVYASPPIIYYMMQGDTLILVKDVDDNLQGESPLYGISEQGTATSVNFNTYNAGTYTFTDFTALTSVDFSTLGSNGISEGIFKGCTSLASIAVSSNITSIGAYAFADCASLTSITYDGTKEQWNAITKGEGWDSNTGDYTITCSDGTVAKSDSGSGESGNNTPAQPSEGQTVTGSNGATGTTNVNYEVALTKWTFSVPAAQTFTKENLTLYGNVSISPESGKDIISLPSGQTIKMTFTAANFNNGVFELRNGSNSVIPYKIGEVTRIASEGVSEEVSDITSNGCTVLTYMAGSSANTGVTNKLRFATTLENIKNAKVTGLHTDTLTFTVNVTGGTSVPAPVAATFSDGTSLTWEELKLAENGTKYGYDASAITDTSIGFNAFFGCDLTSITIPDSVTSISKSAFEGCFSLTDVYYTGTEEQWNAITIGNTNRPLTDATKHYNYVP